MGKTKRVMRIWIAGAAAASCAFAPVFGGPATAGSATGDGRPVNTLCAFSQGPRAGQTEDHGSRDPLLVGAACWDGVSSYGTIVAIVDPPHRTKPKPEPRSQTSTLCQYSRGPRAGQTQDYAPRASLPVGSSCWDGVSSYGTIVAQ